MVPFTKTPPTLPIATVQSDWFLLSHCPEPGIVPSWSLGNVFWFGYYVVIWARGFCVSFCLVFEPRLASTVKSELPIVMLLLLSAGIEERLFLGSAT